MALDFPRAGRLWKQPRRLGKDWGPAMDGYLIVIVAAFSFYSKDRLGRRLAPLAKDFSFHYSFPLLNTENK